MTVTSQQFLQAGLIAEIDGPNDPDSSSLVSIKRRSEKIVGNFHDHMITLFSN